MKRLLLALPLVAFSLTDALATGQQSGPAPLNTLPRYGGAAKSKALRKLDQEFINQSLKQYRQDRRAASESSVSEGWSHFYASDLTTSIKRFNQAWLLDSTNASVYYGFSACLTEQGEAAAAHRYFQLAQRYDVQNQGANKYYERLTLYYQSRKQTASRSAGAV
jgi:tetratricopeptide (TPR) repeat protein